ncbi:hypothetical protein MPSEU_000094400 [Mayamaea pseudoterrestris]|nr:hypothetical protein MPSEU_000094400 [Mayamaea pseudoterrestris]
MKYTPFHEQRFRAQVNQTLQQLQSILENTRHPRLAEDDADHKYDDKFALAEFLANTAIAAEMNALERLGLDSEKLQTLCRWVHEEKKTVKIKFQAKDSCVLFKEQDVDLPFIESRTSTTEISSHASSDHGVRSSLFGGASTSKETIRKQQVTTRVKEYHWKVSLDYTLSLIAGVGATTDEILELQSRSSSGLIVTSGGQAHAGKGNKGVRPLPEQTLHSPLELDLTWFVKMIHPSEQICQFAIDRTVHSCKTPRRNDKVNEAVQYHQALFAWTSKVQGFFRRRLEHDITKKHSPVNRNPSSGDDTRLEPKSRGILIGLEQEPTFNGKLVTIVEWVNETQRYKVEPQDKNAGLPALLIVKPQNIIPDSSFGPPLSAVSSDGMFVPIAPVFEDGSVLGMQEVGSFLSEQCRSIDETIDGLSKIYPPRQLVKLLSIAEATIVVMCEHLLKLALAYEDGVDYIENLLKQQLATAIGKDIKSSDFDNFMAYHNQKLFGSEFAPNPFVYSIRRPNHDPDGTVSIEVTRQKTLAISTMVRHIVGGDSIPSIFMSIDAATSIEMTGDRYLHGWMQHHFTTVKKPEFQITARARQFSSFLLVTGTMMGANKFDPKDAIIVSNKDEVLIPLLTETLPSAKEFRDSIASLSPEQREFAESFRTMQLASSVFGVCVIQLKPQLEAVLGLPNGSLTKEIQLTQDLMTLFVDYQIPSDLMSFDGRDDTDQASKLEIVKAHVKSIMSVIDAEKEKQLKEETRKADMRGEMSFTGEADDQVVTFSGADCYTEQSVSMSTSMMETCMAPDESPPRGARRVRQVGGSRFNASPKVGSIAMAPPAPQPAAAFKRQAAPQSFTAQGQRKGESVYTPLGDGREGGSDGDDFTIIPKLLDRKIEDFDTDGALRCTVIKAGPHWTRRRQANLLTPMQSEGLNGAAIDDEKKKAFDLLGAVTRSGVLPIDCAELHVIIGVSHCFENDLVGTVVQDNVNPIAKVEKSALLLASSIFKKPYIFLIRDEEQAKRLKKSFPLLLASEAG